MSGIKASIKKKLRAQLDKVWGISVYAFWQKEMGGETSEPALSYETLARIFSMDRDDKKAVDFGTLLTVCKHLDFSQDEIRQIAREHDESEGRRQDRGLWKLIGATVNEMSEDEISLVKAYRIIRSKKPTSIPKLADMLEMVASAAGVTIDLTPLRRKEA